MRFSLRFNNDLAVSAYPPLAQAAEQAGFDQLWVILSAVAQATERIQLGTCIVNPYTMHPAEMAMAAGALDELSGGRFCLGISSGAGDFLNWVGIQPEEPVLAVRETVTTLQKLFGGERVTGTEEGRFVRGWTPEAYLRFPTR